MAFGADDNWHVILEFYAQGNIILTDKDYKILALFRSHEYSETVKCAVGEIYPFEVAASMDFDKFDLSTEKF